MLRRASYVKDIPSDGNTWTLTSAIPVVETTRTSITRWVSQSALTDLNRTTNLSYGSARLERNGRGFLGFSWQQSNDSVTGLGTRTYFQQDFPFTGMVKTKGTGSGGSWNNLNLTTTSNGCMWPDVGTSCSVVAGKRYFVYPAQTDIQSWDLDGTALPRSRIVNSNPDAYGNLQNNATYILNPDGSQTDYSKLVANTYYNDPTKWLVGRLVKSVTTANGPSVASPVTPGSGGLPPAASPSLPPQTQAAITAILQLLLSDD